MSLIESKWRYLPPVHCFAWIPPYSYSTKYTNDTKLSPPIFYYPSYFSPAAYLYLLHLLPKYMLLTLSSTNTPRASIYLSPCHTWETWSIVSNSISHLGQRVESRSIPILSNANRIGILPRFVLHMNILTFFRTVLATPLLLLYHSLHYLFNLSTP